MKPFLSLSEEEFCLFVANNIFKLDKQVDRQKWFSKTCYEFFSSKMKTDILSVVTLARLTVGKNDEKRCAVVPESLEILFFENGKVHRIGKPAGLSFGEAIRDENEYALSWFINGTEYSTKDYWTHPSVVEFVLKNINDL